ncbi:MAG: nitroreductase family protein [Chloroflexi bacterium]|nr:nitroreductase family protein [Chloroflexota bacterium]
MLNVDELAELVRTRRTIRGYDNDRDVPEECIQKILDIARLAPSGGNGQPWEFIVIRDPEMRQRIVDFYQKQTEDKLEMERAIRGKASIGGAGFRNAPVFILVVGDPRVNQCYPIRTNLEKGNQHFISGLASATLLIHLAATTLGLGSQWVSDANSPYMGTMLKAWLGIPEELRIYELIPIGYPTRRPPAPPRRSLEEIVHRERYEPAKRRTDEDMQKFIQTMTRAGNYGRSKSTGENASPGSSDQ